jgi:putative addiction module antidote
LSYFPPIVITQVITIGDAVLTLKLTAIGNSVGVVLPKEALDKLHLEKGDKVYLTESPEGFRLTPYDPEFEQQMTEARRIMKKRRDVLHELAK